MPVYNFIYINTFACDAVVAAGMTSLRVTLVK